MTQRLTIACAKGYLLKEAVEKLKALNIIFEDDLENTRKLYADDTSGTVRLLLIRPWDVPVYVEKGGADLGIVGLDVTNEHQAKVITLLDLKFGGCKLVLAGPKPLSPKDLFHNIRVATKYPQSTQRYFDNKGIKAKLIKLYGAIELAPSTGLSDIISDLTATGTTLKENGLHIIDTLVESSAQLIANPVGMKTHAKRIKDLVTNLQSL